MSRGFVSQTLLRVAVALLLGSVALQSTAATLYADVNSTNALPPYTNWATAATCIQDAIDAAVDGDQVLVADGAYATGGHVLYDVTNRVTVTRPITVQSVHGPAATMLLGVLGRDRFGYPTFSPNNVRCAYLSNGAALVGFTLTNGATADAGSGGGVYCESVAASVSNCILISNAVPNLGGGARSGTLAGCTITGNSASADGGGASGCILTDCTLASNSSVLLGGGAYGCILTNCTLVGNSCNNLGGGADSSTLWNCLLATNSAFEGGGAHGSTLNNCQLLGNEAPLEGGGGTFQSDLNNCLLVGNSSRIAGGAAWGAMNQCTVVGNYGSWAGGADYMELTNCIVYGNLADYTDPDTRGCTLDHCCTGANAGPGCITNAPLFIDAAGGDFRLSASSPCINAGNHTAPTGSVDLDGNPRLKGGTVDIGAYEFQNPSSLLSYAWLQQYALPVDGSADFADPDQDGHNNWQEWIAGTDPTNSASVLKMLSPVPTNNPPGVILAWQSVSDRTYRLQRSANPGLQPAFSTIQTNIAGQTGTTTFCDTNGAAPAFYRVSVE
jgi:hypothetical protein